MAAKDLSLGKLFECLNWLPIGIILVGKNKVIRWANSEASRLLGVETPEELRGKRCQEYICHSDFCPVLEKVEHLNLPERVFLRRKGGAPIPVFKIAKVLELQGEPLILEAFQLIREEGLYRAYFDTLFEHTEAMMLMLEGDLTISMVNSALLKVHGLEKGRDHREEGHGTRPSR